MQPEERRYNSRRKIESTPLLISVVAIGAFALVRWLERRRPLREPVAATSMRTARNAVLFASSALVIRVLQGPLLVPLAREVRQRRIGLLQQLKMPQLLRRALAVLLLDYTLWWWHWMNHRIPMLWRFHLVHHLDEDLDATTAFRFHFGEMALSVPYRLAQVAIIGADETALRWWERLLQLCVVFHHSNIDLGFSRDRKVARWIVTPRMHGIHHSAIREQTDSNWSSILTAWDALHGTLLLDIPQESIEIGVEGAREQDLGQLLARPFEKIAAATVASGSASRQD